jgi:hypothetical protein
MVVLIVREFPQFIEPEESITIFTRHTTTVHPVPDESTPHDHIPFLEGPV